MLQRKSWQSTMTINQTCHLCWQYYTVLYKYRTNTFDLKDIDSKLSDSVVALMQTSKQHDKGSMKCTYWHGISIQNYYDHHSRKLYSDTKSELM
uniref:Uncharacterized protein n=1 Tax=Arundo donax TaxID=35708 RepID=A0A0A9FH45_ARUDO